MANTITATGRLVFTFDGSQRQIVGDATYTINTTSSVRAADDFLLSTGSWQPLRTGSLPDIRTMFFDNMTTSSGIVPSVVKVATDDSGTNIIAQLRAGESGFMPWSGSTPLYAKSFVSQSFFSYQISSS